jgi:hypothetical protein
MSPVHGKGGFCGHDNEIMAFFVVIFQVIKKMLTFVRILGYPGSDR